MDVVIHSKYNVGDEVFVLTPCERIKYTVVSVRFNAFKREFIYDVERAGVKSTFSESNLVVY